LDDGGRSLAVRTCVAKRCHPEIHQIAEFIHLRKTHHGKYPASNPRLVTGLFPDRDRAERAYNDISSRGYRHDDVNVVMSDDTLS
jgi:hypothetical protein